MRKYLRQISVIIIATLLLVGMGWVGLLAYSVEAAPPVLFYTDIISGPNVGGKDNNGAFLTICGKGFGATRNGSTVTVGGGEVADYITWSDTRIEVQLGANAATGDVVVHTADGDSNGEPFTVRTGNIHFMSLSGDDNNPGTYEQPWRTFVGTLYHNEIGKLNPGDFLYVRGGDYLVNPGYYAISLRTRHNGQPGMPVTFAAYPNERVYISTPDPSTIGGRTGRAVNMSPDQGPMHNFVFAGFHIELTEPFVIRGDDVRVVNNVSWRGNGWGVITNDVPVDDFVILGNIIYDACHTYRLYHAIYIGEPSINVLIAHNTIYNIGTTNGGRGVQVYNGETTEEFRNIVVRDNLLYNIGRDAILISGYTVDAKVYNNVIYNAGFTDYGGIRVNTWANPSQIEVYNNTVYDSGNSGYGALVINNHDKLYIINNIVYSTGAPYSFVGEGGTTAGITASNNLYYGAGSPPSWDPSSLNVDPKFINLTSRDFHLQSDSPAINVGSSLVSLVVQKDHDGNSRPQGSGYDIGAYEYVEQPSGIRGDVNGDGLVNVVDVQLAVNQFLGVIPQTQEADLNGDGVVNVIDVQLLVNIILSLAT